MKRHTNALCTVLLVIFTASVSAQSAASPKKYLFSSYPAVIDLTETQLSNLFIGEKGPSTTLALGGNFSLEGPIVSNTTKFNCLHTLVIKLTAFNNILFSITKRKTEENSFVYVGHIFNNIYADGYELVKNNGNAYQLIKIETEKILPACSQ